MRRKFGLNAAARAMSESAERLNQLNSRLAELSRRYGPTLPELGPETEIFDLSDAEQARRLAESYDIVVCGGGKRNFLFMHRDAGRRPSKTTLEFHGDENIVVIGAKCGVRGELKFNDSGNFAAFSGGQILFGLEAHFRDASILLCGKDSFAWGVRIWAAGGACCAVGDDCLFSESIAIRTTDHHSLIDLKTMQQTNFPADIIFERHVWVGHGVLIAKGVRVGAGSVIALGSVVVKSIPSCEIWGGAPARRIRRNFSWVKSHPAEASELEAMRAVLSATKKGFGADWRGGWRRLWKG
jgi:acetyltransferase-like isoleucine patch superfamily enzyme